MKRLFIFLLILLCITWSFFIAITYTKQYIDPQNQNIIEKAFDNSDEKTQGDARGAIKKGLSQGLNNVKSFILVILFIYLLYSGFQYFILEKKEFSLTVTPFLMASFFLGGAYLLYNTFFFESDAIRYFIENKTITGKYSWFQAQGSFFSKLFFPCLVLSITTFFSAATGSFILNRLRSKVDDILIFFLFSISIGFSVLIFLLYFLGLFNILYGEVIWGFIIAILCLLYKESFFWLKQFFTQKVVIKDKFFSLNSLMLLFFVVILSMDIIEVIRPFPIGWDDLNTYMNNAKLVASYHHLLSGIFPYNWELVMSLGFLLVSDITTALFLSFLGLIFSLVALYAFITRFVHPRGGVMAIVLYTVLPMVQHFSASDMKIDNALFFFSVVSLLAFLYWLRDQRKIDMKEVISETVQNIEPKTIFWLIPIFYILVRLIVPFPVAYQISAEDGMIVQFLMGMYNILIPKFSGIFGGNLFLSSFSDTTLLGFTAIILFVLVVILMIIGMVLPKKIHEIPEKALEGENQSPEDTLGVNTYDFFYRNRFFILAAFLAGITLGIK
ncbi:MAG: hypothetical protein V1904_06300, partial [Bacteroidota bacterium]